MKQKLFYCCFFLLLWNQEMVAQQPRLVLPLWHGNEITHVQFSPDQKLILTVSLDRLVKIWSAYNGKLLQTLPAHSEEITNACFSPDSKKILTSSKDSTAKLWDIAGGYLLQTFTGLRGSKSFALFSPDGRSILTNSQQQFAVLWDVFSGKQKQVFVHDEQSLLEKAKFSNDGKYILFSFDQGTGVWETASGKMVQILKAEGYQGESAISHDGSLVVTQLSAQNSQYIVWESVTGNILHRLDAGKSSWNPCLNFSPDSRAVMGVTNDSMLTVWDIVTGQRLHQLGGFKRKIKTATFSPDGELVIAGGLGNRARIWQIKSGKLINELKVNSGNLEHAVFSADGKKILLADVFVPSTVWDTKTGNRLFTLSGNTTVVADAFFSPGCEYFFSKLYNDEWQKWEVNTGKQVMLPFNKKVNFLGYSKDGSWMMYTDSLLHLADAKSGATQYSFTWDIDSKNYHFNKGGQWIYFGEDEKKGIAADNFKIRFSLNGSRGDSITVSPTDISNKKRLNFAGKELADVWDISKFKFQLPGTRGRWYADWQKLFSPDDKYFLSTTNDNKINIWNAVDGTFIKNLTGHTRWPVFHADFSKDGKKVVSGGYDRTIIVWDIAAGTFLFKLAGHQDGVRSTFFNQDGSKIISSSSDGHIKIWDTKKREEIFSFLILDSVNFFQQIPAGYYQTTPNAAKLLHYVTKDLKVITFEQLDVKYNRPDKVLEAIGNTDTALIKSYRKAWEKRIKKLGIDTTQFRDGYSVPEADIMNRDSIDYEQKTGTLRLHIKGTDSTYKLDRFNVWVNESPLYGQRGINIRRKNSNKMDTVVTIKLSQGENRIETSITNVNGTESYRMPLYVNYIPAVKQKEMTRFIGIGIDQFKQSSYNLQYSSKDIRDLAVKLKEKYKENIIIDTLFNENVTTEKVKALKEKLKQTTVNDKVILSYSGHGLLSRDYDYYLSTYTVNFNQPEENGLPYDELENLLDSIPARKKLMLIDACHSGEVDKEEGIAMNKTADSLGLSKGIIIDQPQQQQQVGLKNSFELMQSLFVNVGKSTGATIISAAAGNQFALERGDLKNGVFTYSLLEAMNNNPTIKISELKKIVGERVEQLTNGLQKPTSRNENIAVDWSLW